MTCRLSILEEKKDAWRRAAFGKLRTDMPSAVHRVLTLLPRGVSQQRGQNGSLADVSKLAESVDRSILRQGWRAAARAGGAVAELAPKAVGSLNQTNLAAALQDDLAEMAPGSDASRGFCFRDKDTQDTKGSEVIVTLSVAGTVWIGASFWVLTVIPIVRAKFGRFRRLYHDQPAGRRVTDIRLARDDLLEDNLW